MLPTQNRFPWRPLDPDLDAAIIAITAKLLPDGFAVGPGAPQTFAALVERLDAGRQMLVWDGACEFTIYGAPHVNTAFRAWHDWCHWTSRQPFSIPGEAAVVLQQIEQLKALAADPEQFRAWTAILFAEVIGQALYAHLNGEFPGNQRRFVEHFAALLLTRQPAIPQ